MSRILSVTPKDNYCLDIVLDNGTRVMLSLESRLHTVRFSMLSDKVYFDTVTTNGSCVMWNNRIEISLNEVFQLAQT